MYHPTCRLPIIIVVTLPAFVLLSVLTLAQELLSLEISLDPQIEYAVAGQPFTYTVVVTNTGQIPVKDLIVFVETPVGADLIDTDQDAAWPVGVHHGNDTDTIVWSALEPLAPAGVVTFAVILEVLPEMVGQQLVSHNITVLNGVTGEVVAAGPPVIVQVSAPTPTATPSRQSSATTTTTTTVTATPLSVATSSTPTSVPTSTPTVEPSPSNTSTPSPATSPANKLPTLIMFVILALAVLGIGAVGLIWFFKHR